MTMERLLDEVEDETAGFVGANLTRGQNLGLTCLSCLSSTCSMICSARILYMSFHRSRSSYNRIMAGLSFGDFLFSFSIFWQPFLLPSHDVAWEWAIGNTQTCSLVGFVFTNFSIATGMYNALLSVTFLLMVALNWKPLQIRNRVEIVGHIGVWILPIATMLPAAISGSINPSSISRICTILKYPPWCEEGTCQRGEMADLFSLLYFVQVVTSAVVAIVVTIWVYCSYRTQLRATRRHDFCLELAVERKSLLDRVAFQAAFYCLAYLNTVAWPVMARIVATTTGARASNVNLPPGIFAFLVISYFFYPLQGLWNYLIYTRHDTRELRKEHPQAVWWQLAWKIWWHGVGPTSEFSQGSRSGRKSGQASGISTSHVSNSFRTSEQPQSHRVLSQEIGDVKADEEP